MVMIHLYGYSFVWDQPYIGMRTDLSQGVTPRWKRKGLLVWDFPKISDHFPKISKDLPIFFRRPDERFRTFFEDFRWFSHLRILFLSICYNSLHYKFLYNKLYYFPLPWKDISNIFIERRVPWLRQKTVHWIYQASYPHIIIELFVCYPIIL